MRYAKQNQCLLDIAIETYGDVSLAFDLCFKNSISLTEQLSVGQLIKAEELNNNLIVDYYKKNKITPATRMNDATQIPIGIGQMQIGINFQIA